MNKFKNLNGQFTSLRMRIIQRYEFRDRNRLCSFFFNVWTPRVCAWRLPAAGRDALLGCCCPAAPPLLGVMHTTARLQPYRASPCIQRLNRERSSYSHTVLAYAWDFSFQSWGSSLFLAVLQRCWRRLLFIGRIRSGSTQSPELYPNKLDRNWIVRRLGLNIVR
jgi:hypothetical protein